MTYPPPQFIPPVTTGDPLAPAPMEISSDDGRIIGAIDGVNTNFQTSIFFHRAQVFRNGILQTLNFDCSFCGTGLKFVPGSVPQRGDRISIVGWVLG